MTEFRKLKNDQQSDYMYTYDVLYVRNTAGPVLRNVWQG